MLDTKNDHRNVLIKIADILLLSDESTANWITDKKLLQAWYLFCGILAVLFIERLFFHFFVEYGEKSSLLTFLLRAINFGLSLISIGILINMTYCYFDFIVKKRIQISLDNVLVFYILSIVFWSFAYGYLYLLSPSYFAYVDPVVVPTQTAVHLSWWKAMHAQLDFLIFSALHSTGGGFYKLRFNDLVSSIIGWIQSLYSLSLVVLLIASYVNQKTNSDNR